MSTKQGASNLHGWKRKCLLFTLTVLLIVVVINLGLTLWMIKILYFSSNGLGAMKIIPGGIQLRAQSLVLDKLTATKISSRKGQPVQVESSRNISLMSAGSEGRVFSRLSLGDDKFELTGSSVKVSDAQGKLVFGVDKREVFYGANVVHFTGEGGTVVHGSVQTPHIKPEAGQNLTLESPTKNLNIAALHGINIESRAGEISAHSLGEFKIQSKAGVIRLDAPNILLPKLELPNSVRKSAHSGSTSSAHTATHTNLAKPEVFQVCMCGKGRLFLAPAEGPCVADNDVCR